MSSKNKHIKFNVFDLFRRAQKFYGILYILLLGFIVALGAIYVKNIDRMNEVYKSPVLLAIDTALDKGLPVVRGTVSPPVNVMDFFQASRDLEIKGKEVYTTYCLSCHGETGQGDGPAGATLNPPPRNFINPQTWTIGPKINDMFIAVTDGIPDKGMPSFSNLSTEERFAVVQYIYQLNPALPRGTEADMMTLEEKYKLSEGEKTPNQVPVETAMDVIILEYDTLNSLIHKISDRINKDNSAGSMIFENIVADENKVLTSLISNMIWIENIDDFVSFLDTEPTDKGFKAIVYDLTREEMNNLYQFLKNIYSEFKT
jgi:mono/diheme cytochrome c family protein